MMRIDHASVLFQNWTSSKGLSEVQETFSSIDELFDLCVVKKMSPERVFLSGKDDTGREHFLTLLYGAMRVAPDDSVEQEEPSVLGCAAGTEFFRSIARLPSNGR